MNASFINALACSMCPTCSPAIYRLAIRCSSAYTRGVSASSARSSPPVQACSNCVKSPSIRGFMALSRGALLFQAGSPVEDDRDRTGPGFDVHQQPAVGCDVVLRADNRSGCTPHDTGLEQRL